MSIETYLTRIAASRDAIRTKLVSMGLADSGDQLNRLAEVISALANQGAVKVTVKEGQTYTIPAGFHNGSGTVAGVAGGGSYDLQAKTVTPTKSQQNIGPDEGYFGLSAVTVNAIPGVYQDTSKVTVEAGDVLSGKIIVLADGTVTAGTMPDNGKVTETLDATTVFYTIPKGRHSGTGTVQIVLEEKAITPIKSAQTITPSAGKVLSRVVVGKIPDAYQDVSEVNATAEEVAAGAKFVDKDGTVITGTMQNRGKLSKTLTVDDDSVVLEGYYERGSLVTARAEAKTATPTKSQQYICSGTGAFLSGVTVEPIPDEYQDISSTTASAANVLSGRTFVNAFGELVSGTMPNKGGITATIDGLTVTEYRIPGGCHDGSGTVSLTNDIEARLSKI